MQDNVPFEGFPKTTRTTEASGLTSFRIEFPALGPSRARMADSAGLLLAFAGAGGLLAALMTFPQPPHPLAWVILFCAPILSASPMQRTLRVALSGTVTVRLTPDAIEITRGRTAAQHIGRAYEHRFALIENDGAGLEKEQREYQARKGRKPGPFAPLYHYNAPHLVLEVLNNRIDVATIYGRATATKILARLASCDQLMASQAEVGRKLELTPADEQKPRPGGLPEDQHV